MDAFRQLSIYRDWGFKSLKLKDKASYDAHVRSTTYPVDIWSSNFAYLWAHTRKPDKLSIMGSRVEGMLVAWILTAKGRLYMPCLPIGPGSRDEVLAVVTQCARICEDWNRRSDHRHKAVVAKLSSNQLAYFQESEAFEDQFEAKRLTGIERHLSISKLTTLTGKKFSTIRYKLNKFQRDNPGAILRPYHSGDLADVVRLGQQWRETSGSKHRRILDDFYFKATIRHYQALGLENLVVELDGRIIGMTTGGLLPTGEAWGYLTKFDFRFDGLSEFLVVAMAKRIRAIDPNAELINVGTDFGNQQLAMSKEKFRPVQAFQRYALKLRTTG